MVEVRPEVVAAVLQVIDLAAKKGVFVGDDLTVVGQVRGELVNAVNASNEKAQSKTKPSEK